MNETEDQAIRRQLRELEAQTLECLRFYHPGIPGAADAVLRAALPGVPSKAFRRERETAAAVDKALDSLAWFSSSSVRNKGEIPFVLIRLREAQGLLDFLEGVRSDPFPAGIENREQRVLRWLLVRSWPDFGLPRWRLRWSHPGLIEGA